MAGAVSRQSSQSHSGVACAVGKPPPRLGQLGRVSGRAGARLAAILAWLFVRASTRTLRQLEDVGTDVASDVRS